jgi:hypothetical protein
MAELQQITLAHAWTLTTATSLAPLLRQLASTCQGVAGEPSAAVHFRWVSDNSMLCNVVKLICTKFKLRLYSVCISACTQQCLLQAPNHICPFDALCRTCAGT